ncbi:MAG: hypothetical protein SV760_08595, partial [Halobacteria archaeon]|nr:hypothetical protein [Halobacteria archaeon]
LATGIIGLSFYYISRGFFDEFRSSYVFVLVSYSFAIIFHALYNLYVLYSRLGKTVAVLAVIVLYTVGWLFLEIYYPKLGSSSGADEAVTDGG